MTAKQTIFGLVLLFLIGGAQFYQNIRKDNNIKEIKEMLETHIEASKVEIKLPDGFTYVYDRFAIYNAKIDTQTVITYLSVVDSFGLREDSTHFDWFIGQILYESGARQRKADGSILRGTSGEVGIAQIMPSTALGVLSQIKDPNILLRLGVHDFSFANNKSIKKVNKIKLTIEWLSDINNNLTLWGYIMRGKMERNGLLKGLVAYNAGTGGMMKFISQFRKPEKHKYIKGIRDTLRYIANKGLVPSLESV